MDLSKDSKKFFILTLIALPILMICSELASASLLRFGKSILPKKDIHRFKYTSVTPDMTNRVRFKTSSNTSLKNSSNYINRHGLIKTIYDSNSKGKDIVKGIVITGNSAALGHPIAEEGNNKNTFVNLLEKNLRQKDKSIDVINLSFYGFNSWQENVELARYLNSYSNHYDLPKVHLVASIGGIQDYWDFIDLLYNENNDYYKGSGLMSWKDANRNYEVFYNKSYEAMHGNIKLGSEILLKSIIANIKKNSYTVEILRRFKEKGKISNLNEVNLNDLNKVTIKEREKSLESILENKFNITLKEYEVKKNKLITSIVRNKKSMSSMNNDKELLYIYLPTKISFKDWSKERINNFKYKNLNITDIQILEEDYRKSLIDKLSKINNIKILNMAGKGKDEWFTNISNYTEEGHYKIAQEIIPFFELILR
tara:strand:- start:604 stop:1878 length:1275 start_codon:yes stop_codon:yes gene_type:complete